MATLLPGNADECAGLLKDLAGRKQIVEILGNGSKRQMAGPLPRNADALSTARMNKLLQYEPADLTVSVEAGMRWSDLQKTLAANRQRVALNPSFAPEATVGGVIASNGSGTLRKGYGTARDLVIGMRFATADGRLIDSGGMVVKNVAGLDLAKLLIGSFGTLGVITSVNFRVHSVAEVTRTFVFSFNSLDECVAKRDQLLQSVLQPDVLDIFSPVASARLGLRGYVLMLVAGGTARVLERYSRELPGALALDGPAENELRQKVRDFTTEFLKRQKLGVVVRVSTTLAGVRALLKTVSDAVVTRASAGVSYVYLNSAQSLPALWRAVLENKWAAAIEFAPDDVRGRQELWANADRASFQLMQKIKLMFDPEGILNPGRMYGRI